MSASEWLIIAAILIASVAALWAIWPKAPPIPTERRRCSRCRDETEHHPERGCMTCWWQGEQW